MISDKTKGVIGLIMILMIMVPIVSAGPGIKWSQESSLVPEKTKTCLTYEVYNPWAKDSYVQIKLSEELNEIVKSSESETKFIPAYTSSKDALPIEFCFKTPKVYKEDCLIGDALICESRCEEDMKMYQGQVEVIELSEEEAKVGAGAGGSKTQMSVSAPLRVRVQCIPSGYNYSVVYILIALISGALLAANLLKKKKKPTKTTKKKASKKSSKKK